MCKKKINKNQVHSPQSIVDSRQSTVSRVSVFFLWTIVCGLWTATVFAEVSIETSVSRSRVALGEELTLDVIISNAEGDISNPKISSIEGFNCYSQGRSQEISIINGHSSSRSIFSYVLIANAAGKKTIGPFEVSIGGKNFKIAPVEIEVISGGGGFSPQQTGNVFSQAPAAYSAPPRAVSSPDSVSNQDIFVKVWLDKNEVFVNEPATMSYTIYTRLSATYKGFEKEPTTTGFWVEDFPPEKTIQKREEFLYGARYVVADVRKMALFPTQAGVFTINPGVLSTMVETRDQDDFDSFFSTNIFGRRSSAFPSSFMTQVFNKSILTEPLTLTVKALPEAGKPVDFSGAVGDYRIESSIDKKEVEEGTPVTLRVRISGKGNINTVQTPTVPKMDDFKIYDSSSSVKLSKDRLVVEGAKVTETVLVPKKAGSYVIPALSFSYFDPNSQNYKELKTDPQTLTVKPSTEEAPEPLSANTPVQPVEQETVEMVGKDIRFIKKTDDMKTSPAKPLYQNPIYWFLNVALLLVFLVLWFFSGRPVDGLKDLKGLRLRRSHRMARQKLKKAANLLKKGSDEEFYAELARAVYGYFSDKLNIPVQNVNLESIEEGLIEAAGERQTLSRIDAFFNEVAAGRFARIEKSEEEKREIYKTADEVITAFEKVKLK